MINIRRAAIFDLDGTLIDAFSDIANAVNHPLAARGLPTHTVAAIRTFVGDGVGKLMDRAMPPGLPEEETAAIRAEMMTYYRQHPADNATVYEGVFPLLESLKDWGVLLTILTNKPQAMTDRTCDQLGLTRYFDDIRGENGDQTPRKPDPRGLLEQLADIRAERALIIGDGVPDAQVAHAAQLPFVACLWGTQTRDQLAPHEPVAYATAPPDLEGIVLDLLR